MISVMNKLFSVGLKTPTGSFCVERLNFSGNLHHGLLDPFLMVFTHTLAAMTAAVNAIVGDQTFVAAGGVRGKEGEKLRNGPVFCACLRFSALTQLPRGRYSRNKGQSSDILGLLW